MPASPLPGVMVPVLDLKMLNCLFILQYHRGGSLFFTETAEAESFCKSIKRAQPLGFQMAEQIP